MTKSTSTTGLIKYTCRCQYPLDGVPDDTLMAEGYLETEESNLKYEAFVESAPFDPAANIVMLDCPQCGLNYLTMVRIGISEMTMYVCTCGYRATHAEYMQRTRQEIRDGTKNV